MNNMGAWGPGLYQDDVAEDVKTEYVNLLRIGKTNKEVTEKLIEDNQVIINDTDDAPIFWFALADTQWKFGRLLPFVKDKALMYLTKEEDLKKWDNGNKASYKYRKKVLEELEKKLNSPMPATKKISIYKYFKCSWNVGDTYAYRLESKYAKTNNLFGHYLIIHKLDDFHHKKGNDYDVFPYVYTKITKIPELPKSLDEIDNDCEFIRNVFNPRSGLFEYRTINIVDSSRLLRKLLFIGNYKLEQPKDELIKKDIGYPINVMKHANYEEQKINDFIRLGKK